MSPGGGDCLNSMPSPNVPFQGVCETGERPQPGAAQGARTSSPPRRIPPSAPAAVSGTQTRRHPDFGAPGLLAARGRAWARAPERALRPGSTYFARSRGSSRPRWSRSWPQTGGPAGDGVGALVYMVEGFSFIFPHSPAFLLPTPAAGGRM